jgi:hypothetical protein
MDVMHHADNIFHRKMSSNNKQSIKTHVPKLDNLNYQVWAGKMMAFLRLQGLWNMVRGSELNLPELAADSKPEHIAFHRKERIEWSNHDNPAIGLIQLQLIDNLYDKVGTTSYRTWRNLKEAFGTPGLVIIHANFKKAISFKLTGSNSALEIATLYTLFAHLKPNKAELSEFYQVMLLIEALPAKWDSLASAYMHENTKVEDYKLINFVMLCVLSGKGSPGKKSPITQISYLLWNGRVSLPTSKIKSRNLTNRKLTIRVMTTVTGNTSTNAETIRVRKKLLTLASSSMMLVVETPPPVPTPSKIYLRPSDILVRANTKTVVATHCPDRIFYQPLNHASAQSFTGKPNKPSNSYSGV